MRLLRQAVLGGLLILLPLVSRAGLVTIPETRVRIVYKETGEAVEWALIYILGWYDPKENRKWRDKEDSKHHRSLEWGVFLEAKDGWITIPEVSNARMTGFSIDIDVPAGAVSGIELNKGRYFDTINEKSLPRLIKLPEQERMLMAHFTNAVGWPVYRDIYHDYQEGRFWLKTYEISFRMWPELSSVHDRTPSSIKGYQYKNDYFGTICGIVERIKQIIDGPPDKDGPLGWLWEPPPADWKPPTEEQKRDLWERVKSLICTDLMEKKKKWGGLMLPDWCINNRHFQEVNCPGLDLPPGWNITRKIAEIECAKPCQEETPGRGDPPQVHP